MKTAKSPNRVTALLAVISLALLLISSTNAGSPSLDYLEDKQLVLSDSISFVKEPVELPVPPPVPVTPDKSTETRAAVKSDVEQWRPLVSRFDWPVEEALAIMNCESGGNPNAKSPTNDHGLMQINKGLQNYGEQIYDPVFNVEIAYKFYYRGKGQGGKDRLWQPWSCARKLGII